MLRARAHADLARSRSTILLGKKLQELARTNQLVFMIGSSMPRPIKGASHGGSCHAAIVNILSEAHLCHSIHEFRTSRICLNADCRENAVLYNNEGTAADKKAIRRVAHLVNPPSIQILVNEQNGTLRVRTARSYRTLHCRSCGSQFNRDVVGSTNCQIVGMDVLFSGSKHPAFYGSAPGTWVPNRSGARSRPRA